LNIITTYPLWLLSACALFSALATWFLYFFRKNNDVGRKIHYLLVSLRFLFLFLLSVLLLSPLILLSVKEKEKPLVVFAQDDSQSIRFASDSVYYQGEYLQKLKLVSEKLSEKYDFKFITFSNKVNRTDSVTFNGSETNLYQLFEELQSTYVGRNVGAVILATDGLFNQGGNPTSIAEVLPFPIYSIFMGDSIQKTDLAIRSVDYNRTTFYKNTFPVEIQLNGYNLASKRSNLTLSQDGAVLYSKEINITGKKYSETVRLFVDANKKGLQKYHIAIKPIEGEFTTRNNEFDIFVNVLDARDKILITYNAPHPDISAIKQALLTSDMYQVDVKSVQEIDRPISEYKIIFANQLPDIQNSASNLFASAKQWSVPIVYIVGSQSSLSQFNQLNTGVQIVQKNGMWNDAYPSVNPNFVLFSLNSEFKRYIDELPPVALPFGSYSMSPSATVFLYQRIGNYKSNMPMVVFNDQLGYKNCVIAGEGIWKWRLACYQQFNNFGYFDEMIQKIPQYLVAQNDNSNFRVKIKQLFNQNEPITATAELYNLSRELDNTPEVSFVIKDKSGKDFPYTFTRENKSYRLDIGLLPQGEYQWKAATTLGENRYDKSGAFIVQNVNIEALNLTADYTLLNTISKFHDGKVIPARNVESVVETIEKNDNIKPVSFFSKSYNELSNSWIYWILLILIGVSEWFIRKYNGLN